MMRSAGFTTIFLFALGAGCGSEQGGTGQLVPAGCPPIRQLTSCQSADRLLDENWQEVSMDECVPDLNGEWTAITGEDLIFRSNELVGFLDDFGYCVAAHQTRCFRKHDFGMKRDTDRLSLCWIAEPTARTPRPNQDNPFARPLPVIAGDVELLAGGCSGSTTGHLFWDGVPVSEFQIITLLRRDCCDFDGAIGHVTERCGS